MLSIQEKAPVLHDLSRFITGTPRANQHDIHQCKRIIADTIGVAFSGIETDAFELAIKAHLSLFGIGDHPIRGKSLKTTLMGAVFYNTLAVSSTDFDEGHRMAVGHPASLVVPAAIELGKMLEAKPEDIFLSILIGYEIGTRFSHARIPEKVTTWSSGRWGAMGTAATSSYLLKLDRVQTMHALSLAAALSPAMLGGSTDVSTGSMAKEGVAWAACTGVQSALLAQTGFIGPYTFLEDTNDYHLSRLTKDLGKGWLANSNYFKPYSCCRWLHTAIREAIDLKLKHQLNPESIESVEVEVFKRAIDLVDTKYPENAVQAQFHLPYVIACALIYGKVSPEHFTVQMLSDRKIRELIELIELKESKEFTNRFPGSLGSRIRIFTQGHEEFENEIEKTPWDASNPPTDDELNRKFLDQVPEEYHHYWVAIFNAEIKNLGADLPRYIDG